jgi:type IV pilus biogenesis protein CpaD/CtpE
MPKKQEKPVYDVRGAVVLSSMTMSAELLSGISDRVNAAIRGTVRTSELPRVVLTIRIVSIAKGLGFQKDRNVAKVSIDAASVEDGSVIAVTSFEVTSMTADPNLADDILAEDIAARVRSAFALSGR